MLHSAENFDALYAADEDPWHLQSRWYEARKRALTLACLPAARYPRAYEPGCANAELSVALAARCDHLLVSDGSARAVQLARRRTQALPQVEVLQAWLPAQWPGRTFDLIVISELGYYLRPADLDQLAHRLLGSMQPGATVLACHWRQPIEGCLLSGDAVHQRLAQRLALPHLAGYVDDDLRLDVWSHDARSAAQREGFR